jgi:hypothetical protein
MTKNYVAKVTVEFIIPNLCEDEDLKETGMSFDELTRYIIKEEGLMGIVDDQDGKILNIEMIENID